jgi:carbonic anhydrase/acetyltransferase-like protein (isoleucine patch superfamily)
MTSDILMPYCGRRPQVAERVFLARGVLVIGDVVIGPGSGIWFNTILRADVNSIRIGSYTNIQDGVMVHVNINNPTSIGDYVTIGHRAIIHGCSLGDNCLVGMGAILMDGVSVGANCIIGAGALLPEGRQIPDNSLVVGAPGRIIRSLKAQEIAAIRESAEYYHELSLNYS